MAEATGSPKIGLPAGPQGLRHRVVAGLLLPVLHRFHGHALPLRRRGGDVGDGEGAVERHQPALDELQLHAGAAARRRGLGRDRPHRPPGGRVSTSAPTTSSPSPPPPARRGRGFMPVVAGIAVPTTAPDPEASMALVSYMLEPATQIATLRATNFFPVVDVELPGDMPASVQASGQGDRAAIGRARRQPGAPARRAGRSRRTVQPGLHRHLRAHRARRPADPRGARQARPRSLRRIVTEAGAPCWAPDAASEGPLPGRVIRACAHPGHRTRGARPATEARPMPSAHPALPAARARRAVPRRLLPSIRRCRSRSSRSRRGRVHVRELRAHGEPLEIRHGLVEHDPARRRGRSAAARTGAVHGPDRDADGPGPADLVLYVFTIPLGILGSRGPASSGSPFLEQNGFSFNSFL